MKSSLTKTIHHFKEKFNILLQNPVFKTWTSFQTPNNSNESDSNQSDSFKTDHKLCWSIASASNELNLFTALLSPQLDQSHKQSSLETHSHTFTLTKIILCELSLHHNMADDNENSNVSNFFAVNSVFLNTQMQMLWDMLAQTKEDSCAEDCAENHSNAVNLPWWGAQYQYEDHSHQCQPQHHWNNSDDKSSDCSDLS